LIIKHTITINIISSKPGIIIVLSLLSSLLAQRVIIKKVYLSACSGPGGFVDNSQEDD